MSTAAQIETPLADAEYFKRLALSQSGMKDLAVSPLHYWFRHINPERGVCPPTAEQQFGTAVHCLVLEGTSAFQERYAVGVRASDFPDCLDKVDEIKAWITVNGHRPLGKVKADFIAQALAIDPNVAIWETLKTQHEAANAGKIILSADDHQRVIGAAEALLAEPCIAEILKDGQPEVALFDTDEETGTPLKGKLDWLNPTCILDLKTFAQRRGKSIDECVCDAIFYESYYRQGFLYATSHQRKAGLSRPLPFILAFVESDQPHEVRIKRLQPGNHGVANVYWQRARIETRHYCNMWADYMQEFGVSRPWRKEQKVDVLADEEIRQFAY